MASKENKIVRRAQAMAQLSFLSKLLAEQLSIQVPDVQVTNRDNELAEIQRVESINELLTQVVDATKPAEPEAEKKSTKKHGANK